MEHWMNTVKRKIVDLEGSSKLVVRFTDYRFVRNYFSTGKGVVGRECAILETSLKKLNSFTVSEQNKAERLERWWSISATVTAWSPERESNLYFYMLRVYQALRKQTNNKDERKKIFLDKIKVKYPEDLDKLATILRNTGFINYAEALINYKNGNFDINDGKFIDLLAETLAFTCNQRGPGIQLYPRTPEFIGEDYGNYNLILYLNPNKKYGEYGFSHIGRQSSFIVQCSGWYAIGSKFSDDLIIGVQVLVPKIQQLRRVILDMLQATGDHPYSRAPVYDLDGKLVWPTKEELSQTY